MDKRRVKEIIIMLLIILIIIFSILLSNKDKANAKIVVNSAQSEDDIYKEVMTETLYGAENNIKHDTDGTRVNNSSKMKEKVQVQGDTGIEVNGIEITSKDNKTYISGIAKNVTGSTKGDYMLTLNLKDESGKSILEVGIYLNKVEAGQEIKIQTVATTDLANAYSYTITKK